MAQVVEMTLVTPGEGTLTVTGDSDPELFHVARVRGAWEAAERKPGTGATQPRRALVSQSNQVIAQTNRFGCAGLQSEQKTDPPHLQFLTVRHAYQCIAGRAGSNGRAGGGGAPVRAGAPAAGAHVRVHAQGVS